MKLSLEAINAKSPYTLVRLTDMSFRFVTDQGLTYRVGFYADKYFMPNGAYHFYITNNEDEHGSHDPKILDVVIAIIEEFFSQADSVMLYVCDPIDQRGAVRNRLYKMWFLEYAMNHMMTMYSESVSFDGNQYFTGILLRKDNPDHDAILADYQAFLKVMPMRYRLAAK